MLVGNFARAAFLVHSECTESRYINSRPFRVNAGPVGVPCIPTCTAPDGRIVDKRVGGEGGNEGHELAS